MICQVQSGRRARDAVATGAGVIVAQGTEAGGHGMAEPPFTLLPQVADTCPQTPVVAAGGFADGRGLAVAMLPGAEGGPTASGCDSPCQIAPSIDRARGACGFGKSRLPASGPARVGSRLSAIEKKG